MHEDKIVSVTVGGRGNEAFPSAPTFADVWVFREWNNDDILSFSHRCCAADFLTACDGRDFKGHLLKRKGDDKI